MWFIVLLIKLAHFILLSNPAEKDHKCLVRLSLYIVLSMYWFSEIPLRASCRPIPGLMYTSDHRDISWLFRQKPGFRSGHCLGNTFLHPRVSVDIDYCKVFLD
jgi:hypothetical protein